MRVNIGCGQSPLTGWRNFDNSPSLWLAKIPLLPYLLFKLKLVNEEQYRFIYYLKGRSIEYANAVKKVPLPDESADVVYSSHMLEHLYREDAVRFLKEVRRILKPHGIIRLAVPDLRGLTEMYLKSGNADDYLSGIALSLPPLITLFDRIKFIFIGYRRHKWMYDAESLTLLLEKAGFLNIKVLEAGESRIENPGKLNLSERESESIYIEAEKL